MLRTPLCGLVGIDVPIVQAGMSRFTNPELVVAVTEAGALGSLGAWRRSTEQLRRDVQAIRERTNRPFAINHVVPDLDPEGFAVTLDLAPAVVSFALDDAGSCIDEVHGAGSLVMQQVTTVGQAVRAAEHGADIIVAQGTEAGGYSGNVAGLALVPQVVDAVHPVPVIASGGIADGRGLAAALVLGAVGVNVGTRFLASDEAPVGQDWKRAITESASEQWIHLDFFNHLSPNPGTVGYGTRLRGLRTEYTDRWQARIAELAVDPSPAVRELVEADAAGLSEQLLVAGGQSAGLIHSSLPAADIVRQFVEDAERILRSAALLVA